MRMPFSLRMDCWLSRLVGPQSHGAWLVSITSNERLLTDAILVRDYAIRIGRLGDDSLPDAIAALESSHERPSGAAMVALAAALNAAIPRIAPVTLMDLRTGRGPFDEAQARRSAIIHSLLGAIALVLITIIAYISYHLHDETTALGIIQRVNDAHVLDKLTDIRMIAKRGEVFKSAGLELEDYHRRIRELRDLYDELNGSNAVLQGYLYRNGLKVDLQGAVATPTETQRSTSHSQVSKPAEAGFVSSGDVALGPASMAPSNQTTQITNRNVTMNAAAGPPQATGDDPLLQDVCTPNVADKLLAPFNSSWIKAVILDSLDEYCFSSKLNLGESFGHTGHGYGVQTGDIYQLQNSVAYQTTWILPFLYGLLGSVVFLLRSSLDPRTANLDLVSAVLRIVLGGVSGVVIGWFWSGTNPDAGLRTISSIPFALSFLAGFSIDILFSLLDRLNKGAAGSAGNA
jgi:hypothetical protein